MAQAAAVAAVVKDQKKSAAERCPSCASYPLKRSYFSAKFLATPPNTIFSIYVAEGVKLVDWPVEEMHEFLGTQRQWGQYILRDDKLCRQIVAVFYNAYEQAADKSLEVPVNPMDLMPYAGEHKPLTIVSDVDWIAPHLMNTLVGTIVEFGYVPERSAKVLNALVDPMRNRRLALHVGFVVLINLVMWLMFCIDYVHAQIGDEPGPEPAEEDPSLDNATDSGGADSVGNSTGTSNSTADSNSTGLVEWDYPQQQFPLFMRGVYPRRPMGLKGIPAMPFLHYHAAQLGVNTVGFILFGTILVLKHGVTIYATLSLWLWFFAGFGTWVIGHDANHIGCSGMIFGYFAYIMMIGLLKLLGCPPSCRDVVCTWDSTQDILIAVAMIALYTGILYGALPNATIVGTDGSAISAVVNTWEIDLMGWLGGTLYAAVLAVYLRKTRAFKKGHGNRAPAGKRFTSAAAGGAVGAEMGPRAFPDAGRADNPFGNNQGQGERAGGGNDNPFLAHLAPPEEVPVPQVPPVHEPEPEFEENYPELPTGAPGPAQLPSNVNPGETSYV